jgi:hypothetical protein
MAAHFKRPPSSFETRFALLRGRAFPTLTGDAASILRGLLDLILAHNATHASQVGFAAQAILKWYLVRSFSTPPDGR